MLSGFLSANKKYDYECSSCTGTVLCVSSHKSEMRVPYSRLQYIVLVIQRARTNCIKIPMMGVVTQYSLIHVCFLPLTFNASCKQACKL